MFAHGWGWLQHIDTNVFFVLYYVTKVCFYIFYNLFTRDRYCYFCSSSSLLKYDFTPKTCNVSCSKKVKLYCMKFIIEIDRRSGNQNTMIPNRFSTGRKEGEEGSWHELVAMLVDRIESHILKHEEKVNCYFSHYHRC